MTENKRDPLRSQARRDVLKAIGDNDIINKVELAKLTNLSPLTINSILREFRYGKIITCLSGGLYALSGEGKEVYYQLLNDKSHRKKEYERKTKEFYLDRDNDKKIQAIYINDEENNLDKNEDE